MTLIVKSKRNVFLVLILKYPNTGCIFLAAQPAIASSCVVQGWLSQSPFFARLSLLTGGLGI